ncbi:hypothetical protein DL96DRAFT_1560024 [Flagelloscypha sp. PMI_526]|nr:hypothetical protein DL96DRAFT_1560024 [Flagelloscypha sp. PMI_526]
MKSFTTVVFATLFAIAVNAMPAVDTSMSSYSLCHADSNHPVQLKGAAAHIRKSPANVIPAQFNFTTADDKTASTIINSLNLDVAKDVAVGLTCSPINIIGIGSNSCSSQPVCCSDNNFNGVIAIGCSPININLENSISGRTLL